MHYSLFQSEGGYIVESSVYFSQIATYLVLICCRKMFMLPEWLLFAILVAFHRSVVLIRISMVTMMA